MLNPATEPSPTLMLNRAPGPTCSFCNLPLNEPGLSAVRINSLVWLRPKSQTYENPGQHSVPECRESLLPRNPECLGSTTYRIPGQHNVPKCLGSTTYRIPGQLLCSTKAAFTAFPLLDHFFTLPALHGSEVFDTSFPTFPLAIALCHSFAFARALRPLCLAIPLPLLARSSCTRAAVLYPSPRCAPGIAPFPYRFCTGAPTCGTACGSKPK